MKIALIGYGEVGRILAEDLRAAGPGRQRLRPQAARRAGEAAARTRAAHGVALADSHADAVRGAELVISAVTASQAVPVAEACAPGLAPGAFFLDFNSPRPAPRSAPPNRQCRRRPLRRRRGDDLGAALPHQGAAAAGRARRRGAGAAARTAWASPPRCTSDRLGVASATKMCRSVMIKGLEAMVIESFTTARHYGVEDAVIASLQETFPASTGRSRRPTSSSASSSTAAAAARRCARWPRPCARPASALERQRHRRAPGLGGRPGRRRACSAPAARPASPAAPTGAGSRPHPAHREAPRTDPSMSFEKTPGWLDWYAGPSKPRSSCRPAAWTRIATCSAPAPSSPSRPSASTRPATPARRSCSRCATTWASRATWSCRPPATAPTTARWSTPAAPAAARRAAWPPSSAASPTPNCRTCTPPACAACASTSSSAWWTSRPRTS
jgi:hypothetical protein